MVRNPFLFPIGCWFDISRIIIVRTPHELAWVNHHDSQVAEKACCKPQVARILRGSQSVSARVSQPDKSPGVYNISTHAADFFCYLRARPLKACNSDNLILSPGSFGTYPLPIRSVLRSFQDLAEARPDSFIRYQYPTHLNASRAVVAGLINAPPKTVVFVPNATTGVNTVLRNLSFEEGDHIVYFATIYKGCNLTVEYITETTPAKAVKVEYTYPVEDDWLVEAFKAKVQEVQNAGGKVKVAIFDTIVSMPGVRVPSERLTKACKELGVLSLVDAAHGVGHIELDMQALDPDFMTSNCHK